MNGAPADGIGRIGGIAAGALAFALGVVVEVDVAVGVGGGDVMLVGLLGVIREPAATPMELDPRDSGAADAPPGAAARLPGPLAGVVVAPLCAAGPPHPALATHANHAAAAIAPRANTFRTILRFLCLD